MYQNEHKNKIPCTVQVLTYNSAHLLRRCLDSLKDFDDILICDGNSTDGTLEIAREYTDHIIKQSDDAVGPYRLKDFAMARNKCVQAGKYDWNFYIDTDEELPSRTADEIRQIVTKNPPEFYVYNIPNRILYEGREIKHSVPYPGYQMRLFNRTCGARHARTPHSRLEFDKKRYPVGYMKNPWYVIIEERIPGYSPELNYGHIQLEVEGTKNLSRRDFLYWIIYKRMIGIIKLLIKTTFIYMRYGFKDTLPPRLEMGRIRYKWLVLWGSLKLRIRMLLIN